MSQVKDVNLQVFEAEDGHQYQIMIHGYLQKTPVHDDIVQIYGKHQDIFSFFNCHLFYEDKLSTVTLFSVPRFYERLHLLNKVDTILIAVNRYYPRTFDDLYKIAASAKELDLNKIMIVENVGLPDEMQIVELKKKEESTTTSNPEKKFTFDDVQKRMEHFEELKDTQDDSEYGFPELAQFKEKCGIEDMVHIKVDITSQDTINEVLCGCLRIAEKIKNMEKKVSYQN